MLAANMAKSKSPANPLLESCSCIARIIARMLFRIMAKRYLPSLPDEAATIALGRNSAIAMPGMVVWLDGDLGAGK